MTKEQLAEKLNGVQYTKETSDKELMRTAKKNGLVVVYGASHDLLEFSGAIEEEIDAYGGTTAYLGSDGELFTLHDDCECKYCGYQALKEKAKRVIANWDYNSYSWWIESEIPHAAFDVFEDKEKFCRGIVFHIDDLKQS